MPPDPQSDDPLRDPVLYANRELSQLDFNFRVLAQAQDHAVPLLERLRFLCISCTNLDAFFEIRPATVRHDQDFAMPPAPDGLSPGVVLRRIPEPDRTRAASGQSVFVRIDLGCFRLVKKK